MDSKVEKALILCNGEMPSKVLLETCLSSTPFFVAADGGANTALSYGYKPDVIIGDLDSFDQKFVSKSDLVDVAIIENDDQETNDLEKALLMLQKKAIKKVVILGATNKRVDHMWKNISVVMQFHPFFDEIRLTDNYGYMLIIPKKYRAQLDMNTPISLIPLSGRVEGIMTKGLKYPLKDEFLENGVRDGSSNCTIEEEIEISYKKGTLMIYVVENSLLNAIQND